MTGVDVAIEPLLAELERSFEEGPRVVAIGGGHGLAQALTASLAYAGSVTAVVSVADDGGSSGRLSPALSIPPPGDIRRALLALSPEDTLWRQLMEYRFSEADVAGHSLGNLLIAALADLRGDFEDALHTIGGLLAARGEVVPVADVPLTLEAEVAGQAVQGQVAIARSRGGIGGLRVLPRDAPASASALRALAEADQIVVGPGSLFTSVLAAVVVEGVAGAINEAAGTFVYVCNLTTQDGETLGMSGAEHVAALRSIGGLRAPDHVVVHDGELTVPKGLSRLTLDESEHEGSIVRADLADRSAAWPQHDAAKLAAVLRRLV